MSDNYEPAATPDTNASPSRGQGRRVSRERALPSLLSRMPSCQYSPSFVCSPIDMFTMLNYIVYVLSVTATEASFASRRGPAERGVQPAAGDTVGFSF